MTTAQRRLGAVIGTVLALIIVVRVASGFLADRWWFNDLGFASVWRGVVGTQVSLALGGAIFTESIYGLPGLGRSAAQSIGNFDLPVLMGIVVFATLVIIVFNLFVDILYAFIDPRITLA